MAVQLRNRDDFQPDWTSESTKIIWEVDGNPKRPHGKAHARFEAYFGSETVKEYVENGGTKADLRYDWEHRFLDLEAVDEPEDEVEAKSDDKVESDLIEEVTDEVTNEEELLEG
jgi:hypothetical protein